ncbi:tyrosine-protein phosphatase non-receptor type substrate 1-like isoform X1 [Ambystoma mexicanum]|uniref:tyrosine-protein phosphatase non-receptor type substrate 1-like isoform X1 n=1 Tax=Ambystoma mexicanum TaxID=8296 RepID=UPI0037E9A295
MTVSPSEMTASLFFRILLLETALSTGLSQTSLSVEQPPVLTGYQGESVSLNCTCMDQKSILRLLSQWDFFREHKNVTTWKEDTATETLKEAVRKEKSSVVHHGMNVSSLVIRDLQISDAGTYVCSMKRALPPPTLQGKGNGTVLRVLARPTISLSSFSAAGSPRVTCAVSDFYPASIDFTLISTCGRFQGLNNTTMHNPDGTYNTTREALLNTTGCSNGSEVTCSIQHETGDRSTTIGIPSMKKTDRGFKKQNPIALGVTGAVLISLTVIALFIFQNKSRCSCLEKIRQSCLLASQRSNSSELESMSHYQEDQEDRAGIVYTVVDFQRPGNPNAAISVDLHTEYSVLCHM